MKLKNLPKFYKIAKNWEFVNGKLSIPDYDLDKLDIRMGEQVLEMQENSVKGGFIPAATQEDIDHWAEQKSGWSKFYDKVKGLGK
jgi:hypothetical protein